MNSQTCNNCQTTNSATAKFCRECGQRDLYVNEFASKTHCDNFWSRAIGGSVYLKALYIWAASQLAIGLIGLIYTTLRLGDDELWSGEIANELAWQSNYADIFGWGLSILALALALSAIRDFFRSKPAQ